MEPEDMNDVMEKKYLWTEVKRDAGKNCINISQ